MHNSEPSQCKSVNSRFSLHTSESNWMKGTVVI